MKLQHVTSRLKAIVGLSAYDNAGAHAAEDKLHTDVLRAIAKGHPDAQALAREALKSTKINFARWYE